MKAIVCTVGLVLLMGFAAIAQESRGNAAQPTSGSMEMHHSHSSGAAISYAELRDTVTLLERARQATRKYQDVHVAEADGYRAIGPDVPGMGVHFVLAAEQSSFDVEKPPILLYEKNATMAGGYSLVGVSYLWRAAEGPDGQPVDSPFPKALAQWHRHQNICVLPDRTTPPGLSESECRKKDGRFTAETQWMVHAWIWKDSSLGVFSPTNPTVSSAQSRGSAN